MTTLQAFRGLFIFHLQRNESVKCFWFCFNDAIFSRFRKLLRLLYHEIADEIEIHDCW